VSEGEILHCLYFTCVRPEMRGEGVMHQLWNETVDVAKDYNYRHLAAEASTQEVRDVLEKSLGFREVASVDYTDWRFEGFTAMEELVQEDPLEWSKLSIGVRNVHSDAVW